MISSMAYIHGVSFQEVSGKQFFCPCQKANNWQITLTLRFLSARDFSTSSVVADIKVVCQGERSRLQCDSASEKLIIYSAMFGRTEPGHVICPYEGDDKDDNYNCGEVDVTYWFKFLCENKTRCKIKVDNEVFKNPCPEQHLYLQLIFSCGRCSLGSQT